jgi:hypothetical protein
VDTYGGSDEGAFLRRLVQTRALSGTANVEAVSGRPFAQLLAEFTLMLAADNLPNVTGPFVEPSWNLPDIFAGFAELGSRPRHHSRCGRAPVGRSRSRAGTCAAAARCC